MTSTQRRLLLAFGACAAAAMVLTLAVAGAGPVAGDVSTARALQRAVPPEGAIAALSRALSDSLNYLPWVAAAAALVLRQWAAALVILLASGGAYYVLEPGLKPLVARPRPGPDAIAVFDKRSGFGYPSGAAMVAAALFTAVAYAVWHLLRARGASDGARRLGLGVAAGAAALATLLVGVWRVAAGAHWPTDVLGGWLLGAALALGLAAAHEWWWAGRAGGET